MARISGVDLPREKRVEIGLTYIYGIGLTSSKRILTEAGVNPDTRCKDLTDDEVKKISDVIDASQTVEGDLRREIAEVSVIEEDFQFVVRIQRTMPEQEKVLREL